MKSYLSGLEDTRPFVEYTVQSTVGTFVRGEERFEKTAALCRPQAGHVQLLPIFPPTDNGMVLTLLSISFQP